MRSFRHIFPQVLQFDFGMCKYFLLSDCYVFGMFDFGIRLVICMHNYNESFRHVSSFRVLRHADPSGMFLLLGLLCFGMFDFGMFKYFLLSACCIPHTHTCGQVLVLLVVVTTGRAQLRLSNAVQRRHDRFCFLHADFHHVVLVVVLFWSLWPN